MKYCSKCGQECVDDAVICPHCGCEIGQVKEENAVWAILAIVFGALGGYLGLVFAIVGLCTYKSNENKKKCYIGLGLFVFWIILTLILWITM